MVGVTERAADDAPRLVPGLAFLVDEDTHELDNRKGRVSVVELAVSQGDLKQ